MDNSQPFSLKAFRPEPFSTVTCYSPNGRTNSLFCICFRDQHILYLHSVQGSIPVHNNSAYELRSWDSMNRVGNFLEYVGSCGAPPQWISFHGPAQMKRE